ncbi:MAG: hypothetical protein AB7E55_27160 [Pigmentiphaga sp.]
MTEPSNNLPGSAPAPMAWTAESTVQRTHLELQALGRLLTSLESEMAQSQAAGALPGLGVLVAELSALANHCSALAADCRRETLDYDPGPVPEAADND